MLLGQGVRVEFDPQVMIVTCWVRWRGSRDTGLNLKGEGRKGRWANLNRVYQPPSTQRGGREGGKGEDPGLFDLCACDSVSVFQLEENVTTAFEG